MIHNPLTMRIADPIQTHPPGTSPQIAYPSTADHKSDV
jgi:hypothetical protein